MDLSLRFRLRASISGFLPDAMFGNLFAVARRQLFFLPALPDGLRGSLDPLAHSFEILLRGFKSLLCAAYTGIRRFLLF